MVAVLSASSLSTDKVKNLEGEDLGKIEDLMIDLKSGRVAYAVVSFGGGFMHSGKLLAIPWASLKVDQGDKKVFLNVSKETLESAEGFDKDNWPDMADPAFQAKTFGHYGIEPW